MPYVVMIHATFDNKADADHVYDQAKSVATNASIPNIGQAGERTSHCGVFFEEADGSLTKDRQWHIDRFGIVRETDPIPDDQIPPHIMPTGSQDAYPLLDVFGNETIVTDQGKIWKNTGSDANVWAPGDFGWEEVV